MQADKSRLLPNVTPNILLLIIILIGPAQCSSSTSPAIVTLAFAVQDQPSVTVHFMFSNWVAPQKTGSLFENFSNAKRIRCFAHGTISIKHLFFLQINGALNNVAKVAYFLDLRSFVFKNFKLNLCHHLECVYVGALGVICPPRGLHFPGLLH